MTDAVTIRVLPGGGHFAPLRINASVARTLELFGLGYPAHKIQLRRQTLPTTGNWYWNRGFLCGPCEMAKEKI